MASLPSNLDGVEPPDIQPIQRALNKLLDTGFDPRLERLAQAEGWLLRWRKKGAKWHASRRTLDGLAEAVLGWLEARQTGGDESRYAREGEVPKAGER